MNTNGDNKVWVLIVEDTLDRAATLKQEIIEKLGDKVEIVIEEDHDKASAILLRPHPYDIVILDLFRGNPANGDKAGQVVWQEILNVKFVPVLVHTAGDCDLEPPFPKHDHPILRCFRKTSDSDVKIAEHLAVIRDYAAALRETQREMNHSIKDVLLTTSEIIWKEEVDTARRTQLLLRSARRRLAATMDSATQISGEQLMFWEQYIYPPIETCLLMGDLLRVKGEDKQNPSIYRLVLTPSCDLATGSGRRAANNVLVARCEGAHTYAKATGVTLSSVLTDRIKDRLAKSFNDAHCGGYVFLPEYKSVLPPMTACLRDLELIPITEIFSTEEPSPKYERVVSIDSPFREQIAWAYLQIAARPGMPERDAERCIQDNFSPPTPSTTS
jgi:CTP synthase